MASYANLSALDAANNWRYAFECWLTDNEGQKVIWHDRREWHDRLYGFDYYRLQDSMCDGFGQPIPQSTYYLIKRIRDKIKDVRSVGFFEEKENEDLIKELKLDLRELKLCLEEEKSKNG